MRIRKSNTISAKKMALIIAGVIAGFMLSIFIGLKMASAPSITKHNNPLNGVALYADPESNVAKQADAWRQSDPEKAKLMDKLAALPTARWVTDQAIFDAHAAYVQAAAKDKKVPVLVSYFFPKRDCGRYSTGGAKDADEYRNYISGLAGAVGQERVIIILEPDAISQIRGTADNGQPCLSEEDQQMYYSLMDHAVTQLKALKGVSLYIDAGNSEWIKDTNVVAERLKRSSIDKADGFSLNVSNFQTTEATTRYGKEISDKTGGAHFVIDTSRNGFGPYVNNDFPSHNWCNPPGRALGHYPTTNTGDELIDAFLFVKRPGESDGADPDTKKCFGGPKAGDWWPDYAVGLVERWPKELQP
jgi:endoglucanase